MPGVVVTTLTRSGPVAALRPASGQWFVAGITERGNATAPILLRSMNDYARMLGKRTTYDTLYDQMNTFFSEGGIQAWVVRVLGVTPTKGLRVLKDRSTGAGLTTLTVTAQNEGSWSSSLSVEVLDGALANTFRMVLRIGNDIVEDYNNLATPSAAVAAFSDSPYVRLTDAVTATAAPSNNPRVAPAAALSAGTDDRGTITAADYTRALDLFGPEYGDGAVSVPGIGAAVHTGLVAHAQANNRLALLSATRGDVSSALISTAASISSEFAGLFAPYVLVSDGAGGTRAISPEGFVAGVRQRAHSEVGPWKVPAGVAGQSVSLIGLDQAFTSTAANALDAGRVNIIRTVVNTVRLYGWRSLSGNEADYYTLKERDLLNRLVVSANEALEDFVFATVDTRGQLLSLVNSTLVGIVSPVADAGGLYELVDVNGNVVDPGWVVVTDETVNTLNSLANNQINAVLYVRPAPTSGLISLQIVKVGVLAGAGA